MAIRPRSYFICFFISLLLCACSGRNNPNFVLVDSTSSSEICRVVVLPFVDEANDPGIAQLSSRVFRNELINSGLLIVESEGAVRNFMAQKKMIIADFMETRTRLYREFGEQLNIDTVVRGVVLNSGMDRKGKDGAIPFIALKLEVINAQTGQLIMDTFHRRRGDDYRKLMHVGVIRTKTELMARVAEEIIQTWKENGVRNCRN